MKRIYFIRHAKSSWEDVRLSDHDRPLNKRGRRDAPLMAAALAERTDHIDLWLISTAKRARLTAKAFLKKISATEKIKEPAIYHAHTEELLALLKAQKDHHNSCVLFGHNPAYTYVHNIFAENKIDNLPTCGIFELVSSSAKWSDVDASNTRVEWICYPKLLGL